MVDRLGHNNAEVSKDEGHHVFLSINGGKKYLILDEERNAAEFDTKDLDEYDYREERIKKIQSQINNLQNELTCLRRGD